MVDVKSFGGLEPRQMEDQLDFLAKVQDSGKYEEEFLFFILQDNHCDILTDKIVNKCDDGIFIEHCGNKAKLNVVEDIMNKGDLDSRHNEKSHVTCEVKEDFLTMVCYMLKIFLI